LALVSGTTFFNDFDYFTGYDPSAGFVHYLDLEQATQFVRALLPFYAMYIFSLQPSHYHHPLLPNHKGIDLATEAVSKSLSISLSLRGLLQIYAMGLLLTAHRISLSQPPTAP